MSEYGDYDNLGEHQSELPPDNLWIEIEARIRADNPQLLVGLDTWLQLELISQAQILKIARVYLSCPLSIAEVIPDPPQEQAIPAAAALVTATPNLWQGVWQSFLDELSIRWLLFLGIFLVVLSSGVLAASQWQNFSDYGQYVILLLYSLGFWGIGFWTGKQKGLKLTAQTLSAIAILLIPINFWAISHLGLLFKPIGWGIVAIAMVLLTATYYIPFKKRNRLASGLFLLLSYLHLGWQFGFPLPIVYGGIAGIIGLYCLGFLAQRKSFVDLLYVLTAWLLLLSRELIAAGSLANYSLAIALFAWLLCTIYLSRAKQTKLISLSHKSLALANSLVGKVIKITCAIAFIATWWISLQGGLTQSSLFFWQNVAISGLAIQLFWQHLTIYWRRWDLTAIFCLGLQTLYLAKELIPDSFRSQALDLSIEISQSSYFPESVLGVSLFPYLILFVFVASWLYGRQKQRLALYTEYLTLLLGIGFTCLSWSNLTWRSLNLLFSTLTLAYVARIRLPMRSSLIYGTHLLGSITIVQAIAIFLPNLSPFWWGSIFTVLMAINWGICLLQKAIGFTPISTAINQSCWYVGLSFSALSYTCFFIPDRNSVWSLVWFTTPIMATILGKYTQRIGQRRQATVISCLALILAQALIFNGDFTRIIGLAIATGLMLPNAFNLRRTWVTLIHLGLAIALFASLFALIIEPSFANYPQWLLVGDFALLLLYQLRLNLIKTNDTPKFGYISQRSAFGILGVGRETQNFKLIARYIKAADYWAIALIALALPIISFTYFWLPNLALDGKFLAYLSATGLLIGILIWRYRSQPHNLILYTLTWLVGIFFVSSVRIISSSTSILAASNILLGFAALIAMVLLASNTAWAKLDLAFVPLIYAALGIFWRLADFNAYTGLLTLGAAIIALSIRPQRVAKPIKYLGFIGISVGIYELVIYQMQSANGGSLADGITILSLVAAAIAFCYRIIVYRYANKAIPTIFNLRRSKLTLIAHLHWATSSILKIIAAGIAIETNTPRLTLVSIATSFCLGAYAVIQGRDNHKSKTSSLEQDPVQHNDWWVYVGLVEITATLVYSRLIITRLSFFDPWRIIFTCAIALLIYQIPWQNFGWRSTPWQRTAIAIPALMALVVAEDISYLSLFVTALFYLRIAYAQQNIRWSYISLGLLNWLSFRAIAQYSFESIWISFIVCCSILYIAQFEPNLQSQRQPRHYLRLLGSSVFCLTALFQQPGYLPGIIAFGFVFLGLGWRIRAFLFVGTVTLILTALHQLLILVFTYSFLKWVVGLLAGIGSIAIAAGFESQRDRFDRRIRIYQSKLENWQ